MKWRALILLSVTLSLGLSAKAQSLNEERKRSVEFNEPQPCVEFDKMAFRIDAVITQDQISEGEFREAYKKPGVIVRNPEKVFDVGDVEYIRTEVGPDSTFIKSVTHKEKRAEFVNWYNGGGQEQLFSSAMRCFNEYSKAVRETREPSRQTMLQTKSEGLWFEVAQASQFAQDSLRETLLAALGYLNAQTQQIKSMEKLYNEQVANVNAYSTAVESYVATVKQIGSQRNGSAPIFDFNFVRPHPITCSADTLAFSNSAAYISGTDTITNAHTTLHCD